MSVSAQRKYSRTSNVLSVLGCFGLVGCALSIVLLAAAAGWTGGQRLAEQTASARQRDFVNENCALFVEDVLESRPVFLQRRYELLASLTPAPPCLAGIPATATALAQRLAATSTPTASPTATPSASSTPTAAPPTPSFTLTTPTTPIPTHDNTPLANQLAVARRAISEQDWRTAIDTLEAIRSADPSFAHSTVNALLLHALRFRAAYLFSAGELAQAILMVNRAEDFGLATGDSLRFSRTIATYYLDATRWQDIDVLRAIRNLESLIAVAPDYAPTGQLSARALLADQRIAYGDILMASQDPCGAVSQFETAQLLGAGNGGLGAKMASAQTACSDNNSTTEPPS